MISSLEFALVGLASVAAGLVNALAGGGTLITFPMLTAVGVPPLTANITNTVALCPGYLGATLAQSADLKGQKQRMWLLLPAGAVGGVLGGVLLVSTGERAFRILVPFLILLASLLLALQDSLRAWILRRTSASNQTVASHAWAILPVALAAVYGGYFGAGLSVIVLAVLALILQDSLTRLNALKQSIAFAANLAAALFLAFTGKVLWPVAVVMAAGAIGGGILGGRLAGKIRPATLRWTVVVIGVAVAFVYLLH